jgi:hypothetical protein
MIQKTTLTLAVNGLVRAVDNTTKTVPLSVMAQFLEVFRCF